MLSELLPRGRQLALSPSPFCKSCPAAGRLCREQASDLGCPPEGPVHPTLLHPLNKDWFGRVLEINGFDLDYPAQEQPLPEFPPYIPAMRPGLAIDCNPRARAIAIPLEHVCGLARRVQGAGFTTKQLLGLSEHQQLIVLGFANDHFLERIWPTATRLRILTAIHDLAPDAAVAWSYSVWHRHVRGWRYPRLEHLYNPKRSLQIYADMQRMGIPAIPHVYWGLPEDLDRWACWLEENPAVTTLAIDLQTLDQLSAWRNAVQAIAYLRANLRRRIHALFGGVCRAERVAELREIWPESSICNLAAQFAIDYRYKTQYGLTCPWAADSRWSRSDILENVVRQYTELPPRVAIWRQRSTWIDGRHEASATRSAEPMMPVFPARRKCGRSWQLSLGEIATGPELEPIGSVE